MRELIHGLNVIQLISALCQLLQIPCQGGGVTADIDDAFGSDFQHSPNADIVTALAGRVNADDINLRIYSLRFQVFQVIREDFFGFADVERGIFYAVPFCIHSGIFNGLGNDLYTVNLFCLAGHL